ncbi:MAG: glycosyltransferase [Gemmatimonadaceae bacterium]|nr:glycosyltransferase [Gemmatimonadaceae bacterium]
MRAERPARIAYVVKRYPRFSETFIVNEILAHEAAGTEVSIFSLYAPNDTHFQDAISRVRAPVTYLTADGLRGVDLWGAIEGAAAELPAIWRTMDRARGSDARTVHQGATLARELVRRGITHVHAHFATIAAEVAMLASAWARVPFTVTAHAKDIYHETVSLPRLQEVLGAAQQVVTVSDFNVEYLAQTVGIDRGRLTRIYNGLDLERFAYRAPVQRAPRIVTVGRMVAKKGLDDLVRACALLRARGVPFECAIIGGGAEEPAIRHLVTTLGLDACMLLPGPLPQPRVIDEVRNAAVFAAPSVVAGDGDRDGLPTVLLESMALGTPVVSTDIVGIPEVVRHDDTGLLVPERDPAALADALQALLQSPALQLRLARHARALIEREFDVRRNTRQLRALFGGRVAHPVARAS